MRKGIIFLVVFVSLGAFSSISWAGWSEPLFLSELNDFENGYVASTPSISSDGLTIYYLSNHKTLGAYTLYEARRESLSSVFTSKRAVTDIYQKDFGIFGVWPTVDGLGLYYAQDTTFSGKEQWQKVIKLALRNNVDGTWTADKTFIELRPKRYNGKPSLTSDELVIIWHAMDSNENWSVHTASRQSIRHPFSNVQDVKELNDIGGVQPYMSADGLSLYFTITDKIYKGVRQSRNDPFGNFEPLDEVNKWGTATGNPCLSVDGECLYFWQRRGVPGDVNANGIFVSYWIDDPHTQAVEGLTRAIEEKGRLVERLNKTIGGEMATAGLLREAIIKKGFEGIKRPAIVQAYMGVIKAIQKEILARFNLNRSISDLQESLEKIQPSQPAEHPAGAERTIKPQSQRNER